MATVELHDGEAIGTSGDYQRFFERDGQRYSHLIDPRTGQPAVGIEAASVIATASPQAGAISDVATKPLFIGGITTATRYAQRFGVKNILLIDANGVVYATSAMLTRLVWLEAPSHISKIE